MSWRTIVPLSCFVAAMAAVGPSAVQAQAAAESAKLESERPPRLDDERSATVWYGWQTLSVDLISATLIFVGIDSEVGALAWPGVLSLVLGVPIVHTAHEQHGSAAISLAVRLALALTVVIGGVACIGAALSEKQDGSVGCAVAAAALVGFPVMALVDAIVLAHERRGRRGWSYVLPWIASGGRATGLAFQVRL